MAGKVVWLRDEKGNPYLPTKPQEEFLTSKAPFTCFLGGVGAGKTTAGCVKLILHALCRPNSIWVVGRYSYKELYTTTWAILKSLMPKVAIKNILDSPQHMAMHLWNGATIWGWNLSNWKNITGLGLSGAYIDEITELPDNSVVMELYRRLRHPSGPNHFWGTGTPNGMDWVFDLFVGQEDPEHELTIAPTDTNPHLPPLYYSRLDRIMSEEMKRQFLRAEFLTLQGQILHNFSRSIHCLESFQIPRHWTRVRGIDPGYAQDPACCLWAAVDEAGNRFFTDEGWYEKVLAKDVATDIVARGGGPYDWTVLDPTASRQNEETGKTTEDLYREGGLSGMISGDNRMNPSIDVLLNLLAIDPTRVHPITGVPGSPALFIFEDKCPHLVQQFQQWRWGPRGKPKPGEDHAIDPARYILMAGPQAAKAPLEAATHPAFRAFFESLAGRDENGGFPVLGNERAA